MKKFLISFAVIALALNGVFAQDDDLPPPTSKPQSGQQPSNGSAPDNQNFQGFSKPKKLDLSKFILEPDFYFDISGDEIDLGLSPLVGYNVWKGLFVGGSITYLYSGFRNVPFQDAAGNTYYANANWNTFGGGPMVQYNIWKGFFARAHLEILDREIEDIDGNVTIQNGKVIVPKINVVVPDLLIGAGYNLLRSKNIFFPIMVSYNVLNPITNQNYAVYPHGVVIQLGFVDIF